MLVTCPECGVKISELADPCPQCGFPKAGHYSEEYCERRVQQLVNDRRPVTGGWCIEHDSKFGCLCIRPQVWQGRIAKAEARRSFQDAGYTVYFWTECPTCGKLTEGHYE